jgi:hypothetical protein
MNVALSSIEQLDLAARSMANSRLVSYLKVALPIVSGFTVMLASISEASKRETLLVTILAIAGIVASAAVWSSWRYKLHVVALFCLAFAVMNVLSTDHPHDHTVAGWLAGRYLACLFIYYGIGLFVIARRESTVYGDGWQEQRNKVAEWVHGDGMANMVEFPAGSFVMGYWRYRIVNAGDCWLVAKFKKGTDKLEECRVKNLKDVVFTALQSGKWRVDITDNKKTKTYTDIEISPSLPPVFQPFVRHLPM